MTGKHITKNGQKNPRIKGKLKNNVKKRRHAKKRKSRIDDLLINILGGIRNGLLFD